MTNTVSNATTGSDAGRLQAPVQPRNRIVTIDILRGFAIFGILLVNIEYFNQSVFNNVAELHAPATMLDQLARWFIAFFAEGKFYSTFSFLFGLGMAIQYLRAEEKGARFGPFWLRRMIVLLAIGIIHAYLFWPGDILIMYSILGIVLLLWRKAKPRTLLIWFFIFLLLPLLINAGLAGMVKVGEMAIGAEEMAKVFDEQIMNYATLGVRADKIYANGDFLEITQQRARDMMFMYSVWPFMGFNVIAMMILGLNVGKRRIFEDIPGNMPLIRKVWLWALIIGLVGNFVYVYFGEMGNRAVPSLANLVSLTGQTFGAPALALFYMSSLTILAERTIWRQRLQPLAKVGRMALTNYLLQSAICSILFFGYGFALYGKVGIALGVLLTIAIYAVNIMFSSWWLARFRFGPMEWIWRTLTYGKRQPLRREAAGSRR